MGHNQSSKTVVLFSSDKKLKEGITLKLLGSNSSDEILMPNFVFESDLSNLAAVSSADAVIYDLDLVGGDAGRAKTEILEIVENSHAIPLVLIGNRERVLTALRSRRVSDAVAKSVKKPAPTSQILMVVDSVIAIEDEKVSVEAKAKKKSKFKLLAIAALAIIGAAIGFLVFTKGDQNSALDSAKRLADVSQQASDSISAEASAAEQQVEKDQREIARLSELAAAAFERGDLILPAQNNALGFYEQILEIDIYHESAYQGKQDVHAQLRSSFPRLLEAGEFDLAEKIIAVFEKDQPFSSENGKMATALASAQSVDKSTAQSSEAASTESQASKPVKQSSEAQQQQKSDDERKLLAQIDAAIKSTKLTPPIENNAYSLLLNGVKAGALSESKLTSAKLRLEAALVAQTEEAVAKSDLQKAANHIAYIRNLDSRNPSLRRLSGLVTAKNKRIDDAKLQAAEKLKQQQRASELSDARSDSQSKKLTSASGITPFEIIRKADPKYPKRAFKLDIEGWVELEYQVNEQGRAINVSVIKAEPKKMFDKASIEALKRWKFKPAIDTQTGEPVISKESTAKFNFAIGS